MSQLLRLELPDDIHELLLKTANAMQQKPEEWGVTQLNHLLLVNDQKETQAVAPPLEENDDLLSLAGTLENDMRNIGEQHDFYIGQALLTKQRRET